MKIIEMLIHQPKINFDFHEPQFNDSVFQIAMIRGNETFNQIISEFNSISILTLCHILDLNYFN